MKRLAIAWVSILLSWWVVYGIHFPPNIVAGPYTSASDCNYVANELNRVRMDFRYHCEVH